MFRAFPFAFACFAIVLGTGAARAEMPSDAFEMGGLRFGMNPEKATETIQAYDGRMKIATSRGQNRFHLAGGKTITSDPFLHSVHGQIYGGDLKLTAIFPPNPKGGGMIAAERYERDKSRSRPRSEYRAALIAKYGPPDVETTRPLGGTDTQLVMIWKGQGEECLPKPENLTITGPVLQHLPAGADPSGCRPLLAYRLSYDPVFAVAGAMVDVAQTAKAEMDVDAWMKAETAAAMGGPPTAKPKL